MSDKLPTWKEAKATAEQAAAWRGHGLVGFREGPDGFVHARCEFCGAKISYNRFQSYGPAIARDCATGDGPPDLKRLLSF